MTELTGELLAKLQKWRLANRERSVEIKMDRWSSDTSIWIYDYTIPGGFHLSDATIDSDWVKTIIAQKLETLAQQTAELVTKQQAL